MGLGPLGKEAWIKLCIWVGLLKVKVGLVCRVMKTLLELMLALPTWTRGAAPAGAVGVLGVEGVEGAEGVGTEGVGAVDVQTEGCPEQVYPGWIWQPTHPGVGLFPASQVSDPTINPSPQTGLQTPWLLAEYPAVAQVVHWVADVQVLQVELQAVHPVLLSKYCPLGQVMALRTSFWQTP